MLFKPYHIPMIRSGSKTVTRREWADNYSRPNEGSVQIASDEMFTSDEDADCYIRIQRVYDQTLGEMTDADAQKEGDYGTMEEFREGYAKVYGEDAWGPEKEVAVVEFEYVGRERPGEAEQEQLVTDGGQDARVESGLHHLYCEECESNPTYAQIDGNDHLICHCTHTDGEIDPLLVHGFDVMPDRWEFKTEVTHRVR